VNRSGDEIRRQAEELGQPFFSGFSQWTINNLGRGTDKLWAHLFVFVSVSLAVYWLIHKLARDFYRMRKQFKVSTDFDAQAVGHTVLISGLPLALRDNEVLFRHIDDTISPGESERVSMSQ
jgi:hypothetical protein